MKDIRQAAEESWLSPSEVARILEVSRQRVLQMIDEGKLIAQKTVLGRLIEPRSVAELQEKRAH